MTTADQIKQDLDYVASAGRYHDRPPGVPAIYFLWACIIPVGFALPDLAPRFAGPFWLGDERHGYGGRSADHLCRSRGALTSSSLHGPALVLAAIEEAPGSVACASIGDPWAH